MARHFKFCGQCRRTITEREFKRGLFVESRNGLVCATCAQKLDEHEIHDLIDNTDEAVANAKPEESAPPTQENEHITHLSSIREQLEHIHRVILFEKSSIWNVIAAVAQCLAVMLLIAAALSWFEKPMELLIVALTFQVMALTFFVKAK